jgi:hypothetical protein
MKWALESGRYVATANTVTPLRLELLALAREKGVDILYVRRRRHSDYRALKRDPPGERDHRNLGDNQRHDQLHP